MNNISILSEPFSREVCSVKLGRFTFVLTRNVEVCIVAETKKDAEELFCLVFGEMLFTQVKAIL